MGLVQVALGGSQVVLVWGIVARRGHVELDPGEVKLIEVARWEKRPQFVEVGLDEDIALAKQGRGIQVGFDPALEVFPGRQRPCLRMGLRCWTGQLPLSMRAGGKQEPQRAKRRDA